MTDPRPKFPAELTGFAFAGEPLDRADALRDDPDALARLWPQARVIVLDEKGDAWVDDRGALAPLTGASLGAWSHEATLLGVQDGQAWFALAIDSPGNDANAIAGPHRLDLRRAAAEWSARESGAFAFARAMQHWRQRTRFCGVCGGPLEMRRAGYVAHCARCLADHYPRVDPAVIVAVSDGQRLLLGRQANWPARRFSVIAGFVEPGESLEQTVVREVFEETSVRVRSCRYLGAQPWPFPGALMLGFTADAEPDEPRVDGELEEARWFDVEEIAQARLRRGDAEDGLLLSPRISIARSLIEHWYAGMTGAR